MVGDFPYVKKVELLAESWHIYLRVQSNYGRPQDARTREADAKQQMGRVSKI